MSKLVALALVTASICAPAMAEGPAAVVSPTVAAGSAVAAQAAHAHKRAESDLYTPSEDCCFVEVDLDRPMPPPRVDRGPTCCWDASNWD